MALNLHTNTKPEDKAQDHKRRMGEDEHRLGHKRLMEGGHPLGRRRLTEEERRLDRTQRMEGCHLLEIRDTLEEADGEVESYVIL